MSNKLLSPNSAWKTVVWKVVNWITWSIWVLVPDIWSACRISYEHFYIFYIADWFPVVDYCRQINAYHLLCSVSNGLSNGPRVKLCHRQTTCCPSCKQGCHLSDKCISVMWLFHFFINILFSPITPSWRQPRRTTVCSPTLIANVLRQPSLTRQRRLVCQRLQLNAMFAICSGDFLRYLCINYSVYRSNCVPTPKERFQKPAAYL